MVLAEPPRPATLQTLASVRLSQERLEDAQSALKRSMERWRDLPPEHPLVPDFPSRISLARLLVDAKMEEDALEVVERLVGEDDESVEAWYLGGWCLWIMGRLEGEDGEVKPNSEGNVEERKALLLSCREWLRKCLKLCAALNYEDERLMRHAEELVGKLHYVLGEAEIGGDADGEEEWVDEEDDDLSNESEDEEMEGT